MKALTQTPSVAFSAFQGLFLVVCGDIADEVNGFAVDRLLAWEAKTVAALWT